MTADSATKADDLERLIKVLDREHEVDTLSALIDALDPKMDDKPLGETALGIDANVFLRLASHSKSEDIIDYLGGKHDAPIILPGQAIQEFWNNQLAAVDTVSAKMKKSFESFRKEVESIEDDFGTYAEELAKLIDGFEAEHGHVYGSNSVRSTLRLLEMLKERALISFVPRSRFQGIAAQRQRTKTPPGFRDEGDGDFFVWVEFLAGLEKAQRDGRAFTGAVMVTNDKKVDWSRNGTAHPTLVAEVEALLNVPFRTWSLEKLATRVAETTG